MAKAKATCSIQVNALAGNDRIRYDALAGEAGVVDEVPIQVRRDEVKTMLREAKSEQRRIIDEVQSRYPGILNNEGVLLEDIEAAEFEAASQASLFAGNQVRTKGLTKRGPEKGQQRTEARKFGLKPEEATSEANQQPQRAEDVDVGEQRKADETPKQARRPERSSKKLAKGKPPPSTRPVRKGAAVLTKTASTRKDRKPKTTSKEVQSEPSGPSESEQAKRKVKQSADLVVRRAVATADLTSLAAQQARESGNVDAELGAAISDLETATGDTWVDAVYTVLDLALFADNTTTDAYKRARSIAIDYGKESDLLWGGANYAATKEVLRGMIIDTVRAKKPGEIADPMFERDAELWELADQHNMFEEIIETLALGRVYPRAPSQELIDDYSFLNAARFQTKESLDSDVSNIIEKTEAEGLNTETAKMEASSTATNKKGAILDKEIVDDADNNADAKASLLDKNTHRPITKRLSFGAIRKQVLRFRSKLSRFVRPRILVFKDVADLRAKRPAIYAAAKAAHKQKKPIPDNASGYAYDKTVLIFSENIVNKQHLAFVLSHEVIGHFGIGSIMPSKVFNKLLNDIYNTDPLIRQQANLIAADRGIDKMLSIEEALADYAGEVDNSVLMKIAAVLKNWLNKLGFKFEDDMARYFIYHSRRYQRTGEVGLASASELYGSLHRLNQRAMHAYPSIMPTSIPGVVGKQQDSIAVAGKNFADALLASVARSGTRDGWKRNGKGMWNVIQAGSGRLQTLTNRSLHSWGASKIRNLFAAEAAAVSVFKTIYNDGTAYAHKPTLKLWRMLGLIGEEGIGPSPEALKQANEVLVLWLRQKDLGTEAERVTLLKSLPSLVKENPKTGEITLDFSENGGIAQVKAKGAMTWKQLEKGVDTPLIDITTGQEAENEFEHHSLGFTISGDNPLAISVKRIVDEVRATVDQSALDVFLNLLRGIQKNSEFRHAQIRKDFGFTGEQIDIVQDITKVYGEIYDHESTVEGHGIKWKSEQLDQAKQFLRDTLRVLNSEDGKLKLDDWLKGSKKEKSAGTEKMRLMKHKGIDSIIPKLKALRAGGTLNEGNVAKLQKAVETIHGLNNEAVNAELYTKNSIISAYVPLVRSGKIQVRVRAMLDGVEIKLSEYLQAGLLYARTDSLSDAKDQVDIFNAALKDSAPVDILDADSKLQEGVTFEAVWETALMMPPMASGLSYGETINTLAHVGITLDAQQLHKLIIKSAAQASTARHNLKRNFVPGYDPDILKGVWRHLERQANIAGKNLFRHELDNILSDDSIWQGSSTELQRLQNVWMRSRDTDGEFLARKAMDVYQHRYVMASSDKRITVIDSRNGKSDIVAGKAKANHFQDIGLLDALDYKKDSGALAVTGDDMAGQIGGFVKTMTALLHLGLSPATAIINLTSIPMHGMTYLATHNPNTGYGGGHGMIAASKALTQAASNVSLFTGGIKHDPFGSAKALRKLLGDKARMKQYGLSEEEVEMLLEATERGVTMPNMTNAMTGVARFGRSSNAVVSGMRVWMAMFAKTEQFNRRVVALASFRLDRAAGISIKDAKERMEQAIHYSQGQYDKFNNPSFFRGNIISYLFVYKLFQFITVELMRHLNHKERAAFVGMLLLTSGIQGIPFAENAEDLIDWLMEKFGVKWAGMEHQLGTYAEAIGVPSALALRGPMDYYLNTSFAPRISLGRIIPGTQGLKTGPQSTFEQAFTDVLGPVWGALNGVYKSQVMMQRYALEAIGLRRGATTMGDVLRTGGGSSSLKNIAKGVTYLLDGEIRDDRGRLVARDIGITESVLQMIGFYPASAGKQHQTVRAINYARYLSQAYKLDWIREYISSNALERRYILRDIRASNRSAGKDSPFYINVSNFLQGVKRRIKTNEMTTSERNQETLPKSMRSFGLQIMQESGLDEEGNVVPRFF